MEEAEAVFQLDLGGARIRRATGTGWRPRISPMRGQSDFQRFTEACGRVCDGVFGMEERLLIASLG
jgi:hypothetical protein